MASFRVHAGAGIGLAAGLAALAFFWLAPGNERLATVMLGVVAVGAVIPDLDSDSSIPFHTALTLLTALLVISSFSVASAFAPGEWQALIVAPFATLAFTWIVLRPFLKHLTVHRGMVHSIPAALLAGLLTFTGGERIGVQPWSAFLLGCGMTLGYLLHLLLDEVWAAVNFHGHRFVPNKALGSALKWVSHHHGITAAVYVALIAMISVHYHELAPLAQQLTSLVAQII